MSFRREVEYGLIWTGPVQESPDLKFVSFAGCLILFEHLGEVGLEVLSDAFPHYTDGIDGIDENFCW